MATKLFTIQEYTSQVGSLKCIHSDIQIKLSLSIKTHFRILVLRSINCNLSKHSPNTIQ